LNLGCRQKHKSSCCGNCNKSHVEAASFITKRQTKVRFQLIFHFFLFRHIAQERLTRKYLRAIAPAKHLILPCFSFSNISGLKHLLWIIYLTVETLMRSLGRNQNNHQGSFKQNYDTNHISIWLLKKIRPYARHGQDTLPLAYRPTR
jgi:hypothetical protein